MMTEISYFFFPSRCVLLGKRFFVVTFTGSILWIAAYSYLMVWWANLTGETVNIPPEVTK